VAQLEEHIGQEVLGSNHNIAANVEGFTTSDACGP